MNRTSTPINISFGPVATALAEMIASDQNEIYTQPKSSKATPFTGQISTAASINGKSGIRVDEAASVNGATKRRQVRVALYSHDTLGLGHLRRNLLIAQALAESKLQATNLLITGAHESNFFNLPDGVDCLTLPRLQKGNDGSYESGQLAISVNELVQLRAEAIASALSKYDPDLLIVDKVPSGAFGELLPALRLLKERGKTRCILGIRDVLDDAATVQSEWVDSRSEQAINEYYHGIWIYGDRQIYDPIEEYHWSPEIAKATRFTGYLDQSLRLAKEAPQANSWVDELRQKHGPLFVCTLGGGKDGYDLAENFIAAMKNQRACGVLLAGPFMPRCLYRSLQGQSEGHENLHVLDFSDEADQLIRYADGVVAMGGYNTVTSILSFQKRALIVPRVLPRQEQWIRAQRLAKLRAVDVIHPEELTPEAITQWMHRSFSDPSTAFPDRPCDLNGLQRIVDFTTELIGERRSSSRLVTPSGLEEKE